MIRRLGLIFLLLLAPTPAFAWWEYGHQTVATIASLNVNAHTRAEIRYLLAHSRLLETPTCRARTIEDLSVWPDCIKTLGDRFSYASPWHYEDVNICRPFDETSACRDGACIHAQIERNLRLLANRQVPVRERLIALAFVVHLLGDLHQPLHVGEHEDQGGNRFPVSYGVIAGRNNLHSTWDGYLADRSISTPPGEARGILSQLSDSEKAEMRQGDITAWARESWQAAHDFAYGSIMTDPCGPAPTTRPVVTEEITERLIPVVRRQVAKGGLRLARLLDEAFAPDSPWLRPPTRRSS